MTDKSAIFTQFDDMIANGDLAQIVPFLTKYKTGNVGELKKRLNKARHYYLDWQNLNPNGKSNWGKRGDANHERMLFCLALGLLSASDFNRRWYDCFISVLHYMDDPDFYTINDLKTNNYQMIFDIIKQFDFKNLFNAFMAEAIKQEARLDYWLLRKLEDNDLIDYHAPLFARGLAFAYLPEKNRWNYKIDLETYRQQFLASDIKVRDLLSLFDYETEIYNEFLYGIQVPNNFNYKKHGYDSLADYLKNNSGIWRYFIPEYIKQGKLDRSFVLQKCVEIQSNFWNASSKKFFKELFFNLNPSDNEILSLQEQFLTLLHSEFKPTVNFAIDTLKSVIQHPAFNLNDYFEFLMPVMMNIEFKGTIKTILIQLDKLLKQNPALIVSIYPLLTNVLFVADLSLQERAVKILVKYANADRLGGDLETLNTTLELVIDSLNPDIKTLLQPIYQTKTDDNKNTVIALLDKFSYHYDDNATIDYFADNKQFILYDNFNDLLFNFGQLETSSPIEIERFMASWLFLKQKGQFPVNYLDQFKTVLEKYRFKYSANVPFYLFKTALIVEIFSAKEEKIENDYYEFKILRYLKSYNTLINQFIELNRLETPLPLLSTPTHSPAFIDPVVLVERLLAYQDANITIDLTDYAIALARTPRQHTKTAIELLPKLNHELIVESLKFAFGLSGIETTVPSVYQMQLMGVDHSKEKLDDLANEISQKEQAIKNNQDNQNIAKHLMDKLTKSIQNGFKAFDGNYSQTIYQGWRGVFATIAKTHYKNMALDTSHKDARLFDVVLPYDNLATDYYHKPIVEHREYNFKTNSTTITHTGKHQIRFTTNPYLRFAHTSDIYRQICYKHDSYGFYFWSEMIYSLLLQKYLTPLNQSDYDKFLAHCIFYDDDITNKHALPLLQKIMTEEYPYNAYTQFILVACLFSKEKLLRLAGVEVVIYAISQFKLDIEVFARHSSEWIIHQSAPFSRYAECIHHLSNNDVVYQQVILEIIECTILKLTFTDKLPTQFKKYIESYYALLSGLNKQPSDEILTKLNDFVKISNSLKPIVNKIGKLQ